MESDAVDFDRRPPPQIEIVDEIGPSGYEVPIRVECRDPMEGRAMINQSRRDFLKATTAAAFTAAIAKDGWSSRALAQQTGPIPASEWDYRTTKELVEALQGRKISAIELTDHVIARIEAVDPQINAVVVRDFDRARDGAKLADAALSRGERRALLGDSDGC